MTLGAMAAKMKTAAKAIPTKCRAKARPSSRPSPAVRPTSSEPMSPAAAMASGIQDRALFE